MTKKRLIYPKPGTPVRVYWEDIYENVIGDLDEAATALRRTIGIFVCKKRIKGRVCILTTTTEEWDEDEEKYKTGDQSGWCAYPVGTVHRLEPLSPTDDKETPCSVENAVTISTDAVRPTHRRGSHPVDDPKNSPS